MSSEPTIYTAKSELLINGINKAPCDFCEAYNECCLGRFTSCLHLPKQNFRQKNKNSITA